jgi:hypothetical protein
MVASSVRQHYIERMAAQLPATIPPRYRTRRFGMHWPAVVQAVAAIILAVDAVAAPWIRYRVGSGRASTLSAGSFRAYLVVLAALVVTLALIQAFRPGRVATWMSLVGGLLAVALAGTAAATRMAHANSLTLVPGGSTAYYFGTAIAILAGASIVISASRAATLMR